MAKGLLVTLYYWCTLEQPLGCMYTHSAEWSATWFVYSVMEICQDGAKSMQLFVKCQSAQHCSQLHPCKSKITQFEFILLCNLIGFEVNTTSLPHRAIIGKAIDFNRVGWPMRAETSPVAIKCDWRLKTARYLISDITDDRSQLGAQSYFNWNQWEEWEISDKIMLRYSAFWFGE